MKAIIFNSGLGRRMEHLTENCHKSMVTLKNGESIFERQIRLLSEAGIKEFVITTGPFEEQLISVTQKDAFKNLKFHFVRNSVYDKTNYIYSFYLARHLIDDDFLMLHGDLVFDRDIVEYIIKSPYPSTCMINKALPLPEKDFKGRIIDGRLREVSINIFDDDCFTFQPFYKLDLATVTSWIKRIEDFIENRNITGVYAENALNEITESLNIVPISYEDHFLEEIDNVDDYHRVRDGIELFDYRQQTVLEGEDGLTDALKKNSINKPLVVIDKFLMESRLAKLLSKELSPVFFTDFSPNPTYEQVIGALSALKENNCDALISIGGGSSIDVAKAVKYYYSMDGEKNLFNGKPRFINFKHFAIPTTAGTGSESTHFSVIYYNREKQSLTQDMLLPDVAVLLPDFLKTLPINQKKATLLDALCQATEAIWAAASTKEAKGYAKEAITIILENLDAYIAGDEGCNGAIMRAANLAGKAINITTTTAAHALSYKITSLFNIPHGAAVALCMIPVWKFYNGYAKSSSAEKFAIDKEALLASYGAKSLDEAYNIFSDICHRLDMNRTIECSDEVFTEICDNVNTDRLSNFPIPLSRADIEKIYQSFIKTK